MSLSTGPASAFPGFYGKPYFYKPLSSVGSNLIGGAILGVGSGTLQNQRVIVPFTDMNLYLGVGRLTSENKPQVLTGNTVNGVAKSINAGTFAVMVADKYIMMGFTSQIAGVANTQFNFPGFSANRKSNNTNNPYRNTWLKRTTGGWYYQTGQPVNAQYSRDNFGTDTNTGTYAKPGRLNYLSTGQSVTTKSYQAKTD